MRTCSEDGSSISPETLKKKVLSSEEEHALKALICLWVFSYDVYQKLVYNVSFSQARCGDVLTEALRLHFSVGKYSSICHWWVGGKATISICESEKRWRLLASQTGVILLAPLLLFLSSYLISVLL